MVQQLGHLDAARREDACVLRLRGEFDLSNAWEVQDALVDALRAGERRIVVDLTDVRFMDAQLLRVLAKARETADRHQITLQMVPPADPTVGRVAQLVDFDLAA